MRLALRCTGVNFRDVLIALGVPVRGRRRQSKAPASFSRSPTMCSEFAPGDRVMGLFYGAGPVVVADHRTIARIPSGWSYAQAAAVPAVFLTAYYVLADLARVSAGERVLVHAATGGVGMAAVQLAGTGASRCLRRPARANGKPCAAWDSTTTTSRTRARSNSSRSSPRQPAGRVWTSYSIA